MKKERIKNLEVELLNSNSKILKSCWIPARNCYFRGTQEELIKKFTPNQAKNLLTNLYNKKHLSIFEQSFFQFRIKGSRSLLAQLTRHRIGWSYAVQSQHFQDHDNFQFKDLETYLSPEHKREYVSLMNKINNFYINSLNKGLKKYIAREVLPNATCCNIIASTNLRALDTFWNLRYSTNNTPEIRQLAKKSYEEVKKVFPQVKNIFSSAKYMKAFENEL